MSKLSKLIPLEESLKNQFVRSVHNRERIHGLTHSFYRYPARFSPVFAANAIRCFSRPGDLILDPYMGGGTTVIEALSAGRRVVGNDLNSLAVFVARSKTLQLTDDDFRELLDWAEHASKHLSYRSVVPPLSDHLNDHRTRNLNMARARFIKKMIAAALNSAESLPSACTQHFARCAILQTGQWALDGRRRHTSLSEFRQKLLKTAKCMMNASREFSAKVPPIFQQHPTACTLLEGDASEIHMQPIFSGQSPKASLVLTSPPYPGVHVLYHRWQVDGRKESPAPYWIAGCNDGNSSSYYNFGDRREKGLKTYFESSLKTLRSIRKVMKEGALFVQLLAFNNPKQHLPHYLDTLINSGFEEAFLLPSRSDGAVRRIWRHVPNRKWHATLKGKTRSSREVVLIHKAV